MCAICRLKPVTTLCKTTPRNTTPHHTGRVEPTESGRPLPMFSSRRLPPPGQKTVTTLLMIGKWRRSSTPNGRERKVEVLDTSSYSDVPTSGTNGRPSRTSQMRQTSCCNTIIAISILSNLLPIIHHYGRVAAGPIPGYIYGRACVPVECHVGGLSR